MAKRHWYGEPAENEPQPNDHTWENDRYCNLSFTDDDYLITCHYCGELTVRVTFETHRYSEGTEYSSYTEQSCGCPLFADDDIQYTECWQETMAERQYAWMNGGYEI